MFLQCVSIVSTTMFFYKLLFFLMPLNSNEFNFFFKVNIWRPKQYSPGTLVCDNQGHFFKHFNNRLLCLERKSHLEYQHLKPIRLEQFWLKEKPETHSLYLLSTHSCLPASEVQQNNFWKPPSWMKCFRQFSVIIPWSWTLGQHWLSTWGNNYSSIH